MLKLYDNKTELLVVTTKDHISQAQLMSVSVGGEAVVPKPSEPPRNLGVTFDSTMGLTTHINKLCKSLNLYSMCIPPASVKFVNTWI